jgi:hypothetical protein
MTNTGRAISSCFASSDFEDKGFYSIITIPMVAHHFVFEHGMKGEPALLALKLLVGQCS